MLEHVKADHPLRYRTLAEAEHLMKRDIVEQSLLLGFLPVTLPEPIADLVAEAEPPSRRSRQVRAAPRSATAKTRAKKSEAPPTEAPAVAATPRNAHASSRHLPSRPPARRGNGALASRAVDDPPDRD